MLSITYTDDNQLLEFLSTEMSMSPEDFLCEIEDKLESGELTREEAAQLIHDFNNAH